MLLYFLLAYFISNPATPTCHLSSLVESHLSSMLMRTGRGHFDSWAEHGGRLRPDETKQRGSGPILGARRAVNPRGASMRQRGLLLLIVVRVPAKKFLLPPGQQVKRRLRAVNSPGGV